MKFTADIRYDADPARVHAMLTDPRFLQEVCEATGALRHEVDVADDGSGGHTVMTRRTLPADGLPDFVRSFVGDTLQVERVDVWSPAGPDGGRRGTVSVQISGAPVRLTGTLVLGPDGAGSLEQIVGDLKASVPLFGGKVEQAAEPAIRAAVAKEQQVGTRWLAG